MNTSFVSEKITPLVILLLCVSNCVLGQDEQSITEAAKKHMYSFTYDTSFQGEGWEKMKEIAVQHKHFLLGEDHGFAEIPLLTKALINHVNYDLFVTEIDSVTASVARQVAAQEKSQMDAFHADNPSSLSFFSAKEEFELMKAFAESGTDVWGLDQVSLFSTGIVLRRLSEVCKSTEAKALTTQLATHSDKLFLEATKTGKFDTLFIFSSKQKVFDNLRKVLENESQEAKSILNDIEMSWKIYNNIDHANHYTRISGMKSKLLNYYLNTASNGKKYQKVFYKFGAYHTGKAESILGGYDIGNFVSNIAEAEGASSYHLMVVGKKGKTNTFLPTEGMKTRSFDITTKESELHGLSELANLVDGKEWAFIDLKPLRRLLKRGKLKVENSFLRKTIKGYDGLVIIPETTPSSTF